ncbi:MAG: energy transducer TonB [Gemmatimonadales bacterium]|nr:energy transducer TonB [Gemmatimonadales bacterium]
MHRKAQHTESSDFKKTSFSTSAQLAFRRGSGRRMAGAVLVTLAGLVALILLGPSQEDIKKRFEYYGAPGDLKIMPEISIEDGSDQIQQLPQTLQTPPPPAKIEIELEDPLAETRKPLPHETFNTESQAEEWPVVDPNPDAELAESNQAKLSLPRQSNPDWFILVQILPQYPLTATAAEQRIPIIQVQVAIFVNTEGDVTEAIIQSRTASRAFTKEVLEKIKQWKFGWKVDPKAGRWIELTFNFNGPYAKKPNGEG